MKKPTTATEKMLDDEAIQATKKMLKEFVIPEVYDKVMKKVKHVLSLSSKAFNTWLAEKDTIKKWEEWKDAEEKSREMRPAEKDPFSSQPLEEQAWAVLNYIQQDPHQCLVPPGRVELLKKTLKEKCEQRRQVHDRIKGSYVSRVYRIYIEAGDYKEVDVPILEISRNEDDGFDILVGDEPSDAGKTRFVDKAWFEDIVREMQLYNPQGRANYFKRKLTEINVEPKEWK